MIANNLSNGQSRPSHAETDSVSRGIIAQIYIAARKPLPAVIGALLGALVPSATFMVGHYELSSWTEPKALIVMGGLVFSAGQDGRNHQGCRCSESFEHRQPRV